MCLPSTYDPRLWCAILHELAAAGGVVCPAVDGFYDLLRAYYPDADFGERRRDGRLKWTNILQYARRHLVDLGYIDGRERGVWKLTPAGGAWLAMHAPTWLVMA